MSVRNYLSRAGMATAAAVALAIPFIASAPAQAAGTITTKVWNNCQVTNRCTGDSVPGLQLNYHSVVDGTVSGSLAVLYGNVADYAYQQTVSEGTIYHWVFIFAAGNGGGSGLLLKNDAGSVENCSGLANGNNYRVYFNSNYGGHSQLFTKNRCYPINLDGTLKNNNASQKFA